MLSDSAVIDWDKRCWLYSAHTYAKKTLTGTQRAIQWELSMVHQYTYAKKTLTGTQRDMGLAQRRLENIFLQTLVSTTLQWIKQ